MFKLYKSIERVAYRNSALIVHDCPDYGSFYVYRWITSLPCIKFAYRGVYRG